MLIKNVKEDIFKDLAVSIEFSFEAVKPFLENEGTDFIKQILGTTLYKTLDEAYTDAGTQDELEEIYKVLLPLVQRPLIYYAFYKYVPFGDVHVSDAGIVVKSGDGSAPASTRRVQSLMDSLASIAYTSREKLLKFLYANAEIYEWTGSRPESLFITGLLNFSSQVNELANVNISAEVFSRIRPSLTFAELHQVKPLILDDLYTKLKEQVKENLFDDEEAFEWEEQGSGSGSGSGGDENLINHKILLDILRPGIANLALAHALESHRIDVRMAGIVESFESERGSDNIKASAPVRLEALRQAINRFHTDGEMYLSLAKDYLIDHLDDFPLYEDDPERDTEESKEDSIFQNDSDNKYWGGY